jgi:hypothetical protein
MRFSACRTKGVSLVIAALALMLAGAGQAEAGFVPILLNSSSFNEQVVAGNGLTVTATMDGGTSLIGNTYIQKGFNPSAPQNGLTSGVQASLADPSTQLLLQPFTSNDVLMVNSSNLPSGTLTLTTPAKYSALTFFAATGSGNETLNYTLHFANGSTNSGTFGAPDWFFNGPIAVSSNPTGNGDARYFYLPPGGFFNGPDVKGYPAIYQLNIGAIPSSSALTSIDLSYASGGANTAIWGVSGTAVTPEPASLTLLGSCAVSLLGYAGMRRRKKAAV